MVPEVSGIRAICGSSSFAAYAAPTTAILMLQFVPAQGPALRLQPGESAFFRSGVSREADGLQTLTINAI